MLICCSAMKRWFYTTVHGVCRQLIGSQSGLAVWLLRKFAVAVLTCMFALGLFLSLLPYYIHRVAFLLLLFWVLVIFSVHVEEYVHRSFLGGAAIGSVSGAIKGQTTETGFVRGFGIGAVAGAVTGVQLMELIANGEPFSKVALLCSLLNGKIFMEWVSPAVLKAYQWQVSTTETSLREMSDIFEVTTVRGLSQDTIKELPVYQFCNAQNTPSCSEATCAICLQINGLPDKETAQYAEKMSDRSWKTTDELEQMPVLKRYEERRN
ncbi:UNVERIFIED_CONTAM: hypothetical protein Sradi_5341500 [Sesamum radiatum]|uniref:Uncharacterized protein n=1 Tax=Sesamum radiatum TaxID=300843 RepID=A0AAW2LR04_SESRA